MQQGVYVKSCRNTLIMGDGTCLSKLLLTPVETYVLSNPLVVFTLSVSSDCPVPNAFRFRTIQPFYVSPGRGKQIMVAFAHRMFRGVGFTAQLFFLTS